MKKPVYTGRTENKLGQYKCYHANMQGILRVLSSLSDGYFKNNKLNKEVFTELLKRFGNHNRVSGKDIGMARVQRDMGYFLLLTAKNHDFSEYKGDTRDLGDLAQKVGYKKSEYPDIMQMIEEAEKAIETLGEQPPAENMLKLEATQIAALVREVLHSS